MKALLIPTEDPPKVIEIDASDGSGYKDLQRLVTPEGHDHGFIEGLSYPTPNTTAFGNEEAKLFDPPLPPNRVASALIYGDAAEARKRKAEELKDLEERGFFIVDMPDLTDIPEPYIAGPVVVTGVGPEGETTEVSSEAMVVAFFIYNVLNTEEEQA